MGEPGDHTFETEGDGITAVRIKGLGGPVIMYSGSDILGFQQEAAAVAAREGHEPIVLFSEETAFEDVRHSPFLGDYLPEGWEPLLFTTIEPYVDSEVAALINKAQGECASQLEGETILFCDVSGFGQDDERALSVKQLAQVAPALVQAAAELDVNFGALLYEVGQFQGYVRIVQKEGDFVA